MYTDDDLYTAVKAGVIEESAVVAFRQFMEQRHQTQAVDEENFRLISGFNDIFVTIASLLFLISTGWLASRVYLPLGFALAAAMAWGLSLYFVSRRHLALPAILLLGAYVIGVFGFVLLLLAEYGVNEVHSILWACVCAALLTWLHWWKFRVPVTVASGVGCLIAFVLALFLSYFEDSAVSLNMVIALCGLVVFAVAMYWDAQDVERKTRKSDVAFWLHLVASPLLVHSAFSSLGVLNDDVGKGQVTP